METVSAEVSAVLVLELQLRIHGCLVWVTLPKPKLSALGTRVRTNGVFVGYPMPLGTRQYLMVIDRVVTRSSDVHIYESQIAPDGAVVLEILENLSALDVGDDDFVDVVWRDAEEQFVQLKQAVVGYADAVQPLIQSQHVIPVESFVREHAHDAILQVEQPQTHAGRARREADPECRPAHSWVCTNFCCDGGILQWIYIGFQRAAQAGMGNSQGSESASCSTRYFASTWYATT